MQINERFPQTRIDNILSDLREYNKPRGQLQTGLQRHTNNSQTMDQNQHNEHLLLVMNEIQNLREDVAQLRDLMHDMAQSQDTPVDSDTPDNYDMTPEQVKEIILEKVGLNKSFYPSDLSMKYGLDFDTVLEAVEILRQEGRIIE